MSDVSVGRQHRGDLRLDADTVVVGSGAGGAVVAALLAEAGQRVVVLEEGPHVPLSSYQRMRPSQHLRSVWRDGGMTVAFGVGGTPTVNVTMGRCVGGSSMLTGGVCFRTPDRILDMWVHDRGLPGLSPRDMEPHFDDVEEAVHVEEVPVHMRSRSTELFDEGATKLGYPLKPLRRNTKGCQGCSRCNFGCPEGAKLSVDLSYLPRAARAGAQIWSDCRVERVIIERGRAVGVRGRVLNGGGRIWRRDEGGRLDVRAKRVVVAAGSFHTPLLLMRSGVGKRSGQLGRNMTLHPGFRMFARFDEEVHGYHGALQSAYTDHFEEQGITLVSLFIPAGVIAATMHGFGPSLVRGAKRIPNMCVFGGMIHDEAGGVVRRGPGREPIVTYRMAKRDRETVPFLIRTMAETFFAAGAKEVFPPILGQPGVDADAFAKLDLDRIPPARLECSSQHPLGSCRMAATADDGVVDNWGRVYGVDELYLADGSVVPSSLGVNPQVTIMAMADRIGSHLRENPPR
jgi:choline dehydrogenase-like flavoprotein